MSKNNLEANKFKVAMYLRLSQDDEKYDKDFKTESNSISNQRLQIKEYIDKNEDMELVSEYVDDGYSGINFERPSFKEMMEDVITGNINCIIVKDLEDKRIEIHFNYDETIDVLEKINHYTNQYPEKIREVV